MSDIVFEVLSLLREKKLTLSVAESCTGGLIAKKITDIPGCSDIFSGGVVSYSNTVKNRVLGVKKDTLDKYGAVSYQTAEEMAFGVKQVCCADVGISTTGIAGPSGGTPEKPVGTVYIGFSYLNERKSKLLQIDGKLSREQIREETYNRIMDYLIENLYKMN